KLQKSLSILSEKGNVQEHIDALESYKKIFGTHEPKHEIFCNYRVMQHINKRLVKLYQELGAKEKKPKIKAEIKKKEDKASNEAKIFKEKYKTWKTWKKEDALMEKISSIFQDKTDP